MIPRKKWAKQPSSAACSEGKIDMASKEVPITFRSIRGQEKAKTFLNRILVSGRLGHAYLFRGPDGVGKQLCAGIVAARLNCSAPSSHGACGTCSSCRKYLSGNHPDIIVISPEKGTIKIDRVRELCRSLSYPPYESELRVVVLEDVHTMRAEAANSLLKTLEEPPENNLLILTAESSREVLPTIVSRCQSIPFYGLTTGQTVEVLREQASHIEQMEADMLSRLAEGSPGRALLLQEKGLVDIWKSVVEVITTAELESSTGRTLQMAEILAALKEDLIPLFGLLRIWVRDLMMEKNQDDLNITISNQKRIVAIDRAERQLARNCNRGLVCEVLLFNLQSLVPRVSF